MSMQKFTYHTHSPFSDGDNTVEEMILKALDLGLEELGFSDHLIVHKDINSLIKWERPKNYRMLYTDFKSVKELTKKHISEVKKVSEKYPELKVFIGFEVDFFDDNEWIDNFRAFLTGLDLDYLIYGNHRFYDNGKLVFAKAIGETNDIIEKERLIRSYFKTMKAAVNSGFFDFSAHLDWGLKQLKDIDKYNNDFEDLIKEHSKNNLPTELSTRRLVREGYLYPEINILKKLKEYNIPILLSDDAHRTYELCREFKEGEEVLGKLNYTNRWKMNNNPRFKSII